MFNKLLTKNFEEKVEKDLDFFTEHGYNVIKEYNREYQHSHDSPMAGSVFIPTYAGSVKHRLCRLCYPIKKGSESMLMKMKVVEKPIVFVDIIEVGEDYTERLITTKTNSCSMEDAQKDARDAGYQVIAELCNVVPTMHEVRITIAVEPK